MRHEPTLAFDRKERIGVSARVHSALDFVALVILEKGSTGQPIWPIVPS